MTCGSDDVKELKNHCKDVNISKIIIKKMSVISAMDKVKHGLNHRIKEKKLNIKGSELCWL